MLLNQIKEDSFQARKAKETEKATLLVTLYAEASRKGKDNGNRESTDAEVLEVIKKFLKGIKETLDALPASKVEARQAAEFEKQILESYLPKQASEEDLRAFIAEVVAGLGEKSPKQMGAVMKALKDKFGGNYDGTVASALVKAALA